MKKASIAVAVILLYALTWAGGWDAHTKEISDEASRLYSDAQQHDREMAERFQREGFGPYDTSNRLGKNGPSSRVSWCFPLLPGVLLAKSWYVIGPLWGEGGVKIVVYYGYGTKEIMTFWGWIS